MRIPGGPDSILRDVWNTPARRWRTTYRFQRVRNEQFSIRQEAATFGELGTRGFPGFVTYSGKLLELLTQLH